MNKKLCLVISQGEIGIKSYKEDHIGKIFQCFLKTLVLLSQTMIFDLGDFVSVTRCIDHMQISFRFMQILGTEKFFF